MHNIAVTFAQLHQTMLRPFRQPVDIVTVALLLVLLLTAAGAWHLVLERIEI